MGSVVSRLWTAVDYHYYGSDETCIGRPDGTPTVRTKAVADSTFDPRSPALHFQRTPILFLDDKQKDSKGEEVNHLLEPMNKLDLLDPRSPTTGIDRTPIDFVVKESVTADNVLPAVRLSFGSIASEMDNSSEIINVSETQCLTSTPIEENKAKRSDSSGQRVRTPLACVQKQTPNRNVYRNQKQLEITKRAHINSHRKKSKAMADNTDRSSLGLQVNDGKENYE